MRTCTVEGCDRKHQAKGLCHPHYNKLRDASRHQKKPTPCSVCGKVEMKYPTTQKRRPVCSEECRYHLVYGRPKPAPPGQALARYVGPRPERTTTPTVKVIPSSTQPFTGVTCAWCGLAFIVDGRASGVMARWCSNRCSRRAGKRQRRAREAGATGTYTWAEVIAVHLSLGKECAYCREPIDGQPDPDHVVPLSRGGRNSITNIVSCCRLCNADKCDRTINEWIEWRASRGKPTLPIDLDRPELRYLVLDQPTRPRRAA